jgi:DnaK suppressor protein
MKESQETEVLDLAYFQTMLLERFAALQRQAMAEGSNARTEAERQRINLALERIRRDNYWNCFRCGEDITEERLLVDPTVLTCSDCDPGRKVK